jgi:hypothetical protein
VDIKKNLMISKMLIFIIPVIAMISLGCEKDIFSTVTNQSNRERMLLTEEQAIQSGIEYNDVIVEDRDIKDIAKNIIFQSSLPDLPTEHVVLENATIHGDIITVTLSYSGGCKPHEFDLLFTTFEESSPVQISARILHHKNDDPCDNWVTETRAFNLSLLIEHYLKIYDRSCGPIIINVFDASGSDASGSQPALSLSYEFCSDNPALPPGPPLPPAYNPLDNEKIL